MIRVAYKMKRYHSSYSVKRFGNFKDYQKWLNALAACTAEGGEFIVALSKTNKQGETIERYVPLCVRRGKYAPITII